MILVSCGTPNSSSVSEAISIVGQSDLLPIMIATSGVTCFSVFFAIGLNHDPAKTRLVGPTFNSINVANMAVAFLVRISIKRRKSAGKRHIRKTQRTAVLIGGSHKIRVANVSRITLGKRHRRRTYRTFLFCGHLLRTITGIKTIKGIKAIIVSLLSPRSL